MATNHPERVDAYGRRLPTLSDAREQSLVDSATNHEQVALLWERLQSLLRESLRRGWHGSVSVEVSILDGTIQDTSVERLRRRR